jgi:uncharacterized membrane protein
LALEAMTAITNTAFSRPKWRTIVLASLAFWLSGSLILDLVMMPGLYAAGMMTQSGFASAGYSIFWVFNHLEVLCAALVLTGVLVLDHISGTLGNRWMVPAAFGLLMIALVYTYGLTPEMSALGMQLNWFESASDVPAAMNQMHQSYWLLELLKVGLGGALLTASCKG